MEEVLVLKIKLEPDSKTNKTINDLIKRNKELAKFLKEAPREGTEEYKKLQKEIEAAKKEFAANRAEIQKFNKELRTGEKETEAAKDSLKGLSKTLKDLEKEYKNLSAEERKAARGKELQRNIKRTREELKRAERSLGDFRRSVGDYTRSLVSLNGGLGGVALSIQSLKEGLGGLVFAFKNAGGAAKAFLLTLGPISIAIAAVTAALSQFQSVTDAVQRAFAGLSAGFEVVVERFGRLGFAFENLINLDFSGFAEAVGNAFSGIGEEIVNETTRANQLSQELQDLRDREIDNIVRLAELERDIANAKEAAAEVEQKDRKAAADFISEAIRLTEEQGEIELSLARERRDILAEQVAQTDELTRAEDRRNLEEQRAAVLTLEAKIADELAGLIRRRERLNKERSDGNKSQLNQLQQLQQEQTRLTEAIKLQLLAGEEVTENLERFQEVTTQLLEVENKFKELTEDTSGAVSFATDSIKGYNQQIEELNNKLESVSINSEEYKQIQNEIAQIEQRRRVALGDITANIERLNIAQQNNIAILEDSETALRLRSEALKEIQDLEGTDAEIAERKTDIETQLQSDLRRLRAQRIEEEKIALNEELQAVDENLRQELELFADNELKKQELSLIAQGKRDEIRKKELELELALFEISKQEFDAAEKAKTAKTKEEEAKRKALRDLALDTSLEAANKITELIGVIQEQETEKQRQQIDQREEAAIKEAELLGKTEEEKQQIREKFEKEREELQKRAAVERKALAVAEATIDIAGAVIKSLNSPPPANVALAASTAALGAIQLAIIAATNFAGGGLVQPVQLADGQIVSAPNIPTMKNGDNVLATVARGEVILNKEQQRRAGGDEFFKRLGVPGFASGGRVNMNQIAKASPYAKGGLTPRFTSPVIVSRAYQTGGLTSDNVTRTVSNAIDAANNALVDKLAKAVFEGSVLGSKEGLENANITGQLAREDERTQRRSQQETF